MQYAYIELEPDTQYCSVTVELIHNLIYHGITKFNFNLWQHHDLILIELPNDHPDHRQLIKYISGLPKVANLVLVPQHHSPGLSSTSKFHVFDKIDIPGKPGPLMINDEYDGFLLCWSYDDKISATLHAYRHNPAPPVFPPIAPPIAPPILPIEIGGNIRYYIPVYGVYTDCEPIMGTLNEALNEEFQSYVREYTEMEGHSLEVPLSQG